MSDQKAVVAVPLEFQPKSLLLTGGAGFIMSHVADNLLNAFPELQLTVLDVMDYCASEKNLASAMKTGRCQLVKGNITNRELILHLMHTCDFDSVIHGAAQSHVDLSFGDSLSFTMTNTYGTHVMLECTRQYNAKQQDAGRKGIERFLYICTDEVYGSNPDDQCTETSLRKPTNPYSAAKSAASDICHAYIQSYGLPVIETRGNNTIGPRQYPEKLIPKFVSLLMDHRPVPIHGKGDSKRSLIDVLDCADAIVTILTKGKVHEIYNIEAGVEMTVMEITEALLQQFHIPREKWPDYIKYVEDRKFNDKRYFIDGSKLHALGFTPQHTLEQSLNRIVTWYKANRDYWPHADTALVAHPKLTQYVR